MDFWVFLIFGILHGAGKAFRDTIGHHFYTSVLSRCKSQKWWKWLRSDWRDRPKHWVAPLWDGWHFGDFLTSISPLLAMCLGMFYHADPGYAVLYAGCAWFVFAVFYKQIFR